MPGFLSVSAEGSNLLDATIEVESAERFAVVVVDEDAGVGLAVAERYAVGVDHAVEHPLAKQVCVQLIVRRDNLR